MTRQGLFLLLLASFVSVIVAQGTVWPKPQSITQTSTQFDLASFSTFQMTYNVSSAILVQAIQRYQVLIFYSGADPAKVRKHHSSNAVITTLAITLQTADDTLNSETDESYNLTISAPVSTLNAVTLYGALHGIETFSQLVQHTPNTDHYFMTQTTIVDAPRFAFRAVLIDTARHFIELPVIFAQIDAMSYVKFNVLHWHIVDDQSFPYVSQKFPNLSAQGAYDPVTHVYTPADVAAVIEYAKLRGIRVVPEFDTPGHTQSWNGQPGFLTPCYTGSKPNGQVYGANAILPSTYQFLTDFFTEVSQVFQDDYLHMGGDELDFSCWQSNPDIVAFMQQNGFGSNFPALENYYEEKLLAIIDNIGRRPIVWEDPWDNGVRNFTKDTILNVWKGGDWEDVAADITSEGWKVIISAPWYLNLIVYGTGWTTYYQVEPTDFNGTQQQKDLVVGGSCTFWAEFIDSTNLLATTWVRAAAVAERLWSPIDVTDIGDAAERIKTLQCMMIRRGIPAEPVTGPSFCPQEWQAVYTPPWMAASKQQKMI